MFVRFNVRRLALIAWHCVSNHTAGATPSSRYRGVAKSRNRASRGSGYKVSSAARGSVRAHFIDCGWETVPLNHPGMSQYDPHALMNRALLWRLEAQAALREAVRAYCVDQAEQCERLALRSLETPCLKSSGSAPVPPDSRLAHSDTV